jgi:hypothetical protein
MTAEEKAVSPLTTEEQRKIKLAVVCFGSGNFIETLDNFSFEMLKVLYARKSLRWEIILA